jgi:hypothetical protein
MDEQLQQLQDPNTDLGILTIQDPNQSSPVPPVPLKAYLIV